MTDTKFLLFFNGVAHINILSQQQHHSYETGDQSPRFCLIDVTNLHKFLLEVNDDRHGVYSIAIVLLSGLEAA